MFTKSKPAQTNGSSGKPNVGKGAPGGGSFSVIGADVTIIGNITAESDLHIDGKVEGDIRCASIAQGETSVIKGTIYAEQAQLSGRVEGSITAKTLMIDATARIAGDVTYESMSVVKGGHVDGRFSQMGDIDAGNKLKLVSQQDA